MRGIYLGLGTNLGDRQRNLQDAVICLKQRGVDMLRASRIWETEPQGIADQPWFLNQVIEVDTALTPEHLFAAVKQIEAEMGRTQGGPRNGPRLIDIDILLYGDRVIHSEQLEIPHPRMQERRFVLGPLAELSPELRHPLLGRTIAQLLTSIEGQAAHPAQQRQQSQQQDQQPE